MLDVILKRFDAPDEVRHFTRGRFELVSIGGLTLGRATYEPGWRWSVDVGPGVGAERCRVERSEEHTSELQSPYVISYAVFCLTKNIKDARGHSPPHPPRDESHTTLPLFP